MGCELHTSRLSHLEDDGWAPLSATEIVNEDNYKLLQARSKLAQAIQVATTIGVSLDEALKEQSKSSLTISNLAFRAAVDKLTFALGEDSVAELLMQAESLVTMGDKVEPCPMHF